jgi:hypothetical protein
MADEFGLQLADNMRLRRMRNQLKNLEKVKEIVEKEGVTMKQIDFKALFPLLEGTALEENETLQQMWVNLFTNYIDISKNLTTHVYPEILRQLSTEEVEILKTMQDNSNQIFVRERQTMMEDFLELFAYRDQITNILRLGIIEEVLKFETDSKVKASDYTPLIHKHINTINVNKLSSDQYRMTEFGLQFMEACSRL